MIVSNLENVDCKMYMYVKDIRYVDCRTCKIVHWKSTHHQDLIKKHFALQFQETKEWFDRMKSERTSPSRLALTSQEERQRFFDETRERILQR